MHAHASARKRLERQTMSMSNTVMAILTICIAVAGGMLGGLAGYGVALTQPTQNTPRTSSGIEGAVTTANTNTTVVSITTTTMTTNSSILIPGYKYTGISCAVSNLNLTLIQSQYGTNMSYATPQNATAFYLSNPKFVAFLTQFINMTDPFLNGAVQTLLGNRTSVLLEQSANTTSC